jgi:hypothetical protein
MIQNNKMTDYWLTDATSISTNPVSGSVSRKMTNPHASAVIQNQLSNEVDCSKLDLCVSAWYKS